MTQLPTAPTRNPTLLALGAGIIVVTLIILLGLGFWLANRGQLLGSRASADAILFIDIPGRTAIDGVLQIDGPAPVPVATGKHTLTFFDIASASPVEVSVAAGEFAYIPNPAASRAYYATDSRGVVHAAAFPPNTTIEIPDCTPIYASRPVTCRSLHTLSAELSPGTYTLKYSNPQMGNHQESFTIGTDAAVRRTHSFITTVAQWDQWRQQHGDIIERNYPRYRRRSGGSSVLLLPFEVTGELVGELFD